jgi:hypothetical protein
MSTKKRLTFLKLVELHFKDDPKFNLKKYIGKFHKAEYVCEELNSVPICKILPTTKFLTEDNDFNVCYHGRECEVESKKLYEYEDYFIVYKFFGQGNEDEFNIWTIKDNYEGDLLDFYNKCVKVYKKDKFNEYNFLKGAKNFDFVLKYFKSVYGADGVDEFKNYIDHIY